MGCNFLLFYRDRVEAPAPSAAARHVTHLVGEGAREEFAEFHRLHLGIEDIGVIVVLASADDCDRVEHIALDHLPNHIEAGKHSPIGNDTVIEMRGGELQNIEACIGTAWLAV
jgi:hypothetical protein